MKIDFVIENQSVIYSRKGRYFEALYVTSAFGSDYPMNNQSFDVLEKIRTATCKLFRNANAPCVALSFNRVNGLWRMTFTSADPLPEMMSVSYEKKKDEYGKEIYVATLY